MQSNRTNEHIKLEARKVFTDYLETKKQRKTPERFGVLDEIYSNKEHVDAEGLFVQLKERGYRLSRATVYNTLELLVECGLVTKHQFGKNIARYEGSYGSKQHDHMICKRCNKIIEFCDPRIQQIKNMIGEILHFKVTEHSLHLYGNPIADVNGKCVSCDKELKMAS